MALPFHFSITSHPLAVQQSGQDMFLSGDASTSWCAQADDKQYHVCDSIFIDPLLNCTTYMVIISYNLHKREKTKWQMWASAGEAIIEEEEKGNKTI